MKLIDISVPLNENTPTWPGHSPFSCRERKSKLGMVISDLCFGSHLGTHVDAPKHCAPNAGGLEVYSLEAFIGACYVFDMGKAEAIDSRMLEEKRIPSEARIILKTSNSARDLMQFFDDYVFLTPDAAEYLAFKKTILVGVDGFSIVQAASRQPSSFFDNRAHEILLGNRIPIIESLNLSLVSEGNYILIAPPLPLNGIDGCPIRAVLLQSNESVPLPLRE